MSIADPWHLIQKRFPSSEYALLQEVRDKAGFYASRAADGVAMNLWPSRGLHVSGIEIKSYRSDWLSELKKPAKAENIYKFCDYWWLIAAAENVVKPEEVPKTWGFMEVTNGKLKTIIDAPKLTPEAMDRHFVAALLKRATKGMIPASSIDKRIEEEAERRAESKRTSSDRTMDRLTSELKDANQLIRDFEEKTGVRINRWNRGQIMDAVKILADGDSRKELERNLSQTKAKYEAICKAMDQIINLNNTQSP